MDKQNYKWIILFKLLILKKNSNKIQKKITMDLNILNKLNLYLSNSIKLLLVLNKCQNKKSYVFKNEKNLIYNYSNFMINISN